MKNMEVNMLLDIKEIRRNNLIAAIKIAGSAAKLYSVSGISPSAISQMKNESGAKSIGEKVARKIEESLNLPHAWMDQAHDTQNIHANVEPGPDIAGKVPLISWVQAGAWAEVIDNFHPGDAEDWIDTTANVSSQSFALRVKGDSMTNPHGTPSIPEGSMVVVDPNAHCDNGNIVVARLNDSMEATIKKLVIDGGQRYLKPLNPAYPTIAINGNCHIIGRAVRLELDL